MAASDESEHVAHYVVWLCVAIFVYISRHPRHSSLFSTTLHFAPSQAFFVILHYLVFRAIRGIVYYF